MFRWLKTELDDILGIYVTFRRNVNLQDKFNDFLKTRANARNNTQHVGSLDETTKDSGTFSISDAMLISCSHVFGYVACSARSLAQHCWMCCATRTQHCWTTLR